MKASKKMILLMLLVIPMAFVSCKKEGCTDPAATNYSEKAKKDDGSCKYAEDAATTGDLQVKVTDENGQPRADHEVKVYKGKHETTYENLVETGHTNQQGIIVFEKLEPGFYTAKVTLSQGGGYGSSEAAVEVKKGQTASVVLDI